MVSAIRLLLLDLLQFRFQAVGVDLLALSLMWEVHKLAFRAALPRDVATAEPSMGARICLACTASVSTFDTWQRLHHISFSTPFASPSLNKPLLHTPHTPEPACRAQECFQKHINSIKTQSQKMSWLAHPGSRSP
jgi:hypothetical protein